MDIQLKDKLKKNSDVVLDSRGLKDYGGRLSNNHTTKSLKIVVLLKQKRHRFRELI